MARIGLPWSLPLRYFGLGAITVGAIIGGIVAVKHEVASPPLAAGMKSAGDIIFANRFEEGSGGSPLPPVEPPLVVVSGECPAPPAGFFRVSKDWQRRWAWGYPCDRMASCERTLHGYPEGQSYPAPLGANKGTYETTPFVPRAESVQIYFDQVQPRASAGYSQRPARGMLLAISKCPGQFTGLPAGCAYYGNSGAFTWSTSAHPGVCTVTEGETWYLNVIAADPEGGIEPGEHTCENVAATAAGCDVGAVIGVGPQ